MFPPNLSQLSPAARIGALFSATRYASRTQLIAWLELCELAEGNSPRNDSSWKDYIRRKALRAIAYVIRSGELLVIPGTALQVSPFFSQPIVDTSFDLRTVDLFAVTTVIKRRWLLQARRNQNHYTTPLHNDAPDFGGEDFVRLSERVSLTSVFLTLARESLGTPEFLTDWQLQRDWSGPLIESYISASYRYDGDPVQISVERPPVSFGLDSMRRYLEDFYVFAADAGTRRQLWVPEQ